MSKIIVRMSKCLWFVARAYEIDGYCGGVQLSDHGADNLSWDGRGAQDDKICKTKTETTATLIDVVKDKCGNGVSTIVLFEVASVEKDRREFPQLLYERIVRDKEGGAWKATKSAPYTNKNSGNKIVDIIIRRVDKKAGK